MGRAFGRPVPFTLEGAQERLDRYWEGDYRLSVDDPDDEDDEDDDLW